MFDIGSCSYFHKQARGVRAGSLVFVHQGGHGAISLVIVAGRRETGGDDAEEVTLLVRGM